MKVISWVQFVDKVVDAPVGVRVVMPETVEYPQLQFIAGPRLFLDKDVDMPIAVHVETLKTVEVPQLLFIVIVSSSWTRLLTCTLLCTSGC